MRTAQLESRSLATAVPGRQLARAEAVVPIPDGLLRHMVQDTLGRPGWDPGLRGAEWVAGQPGQPDSLTRLEADIGAWKVRALHMLVATSQDTIVCAGGGRRWRFVEVVHLSRLDASFTRIERTVELWLWGRLRWAGVPLRLYLARYLRRSLSALI